MLASGIKLKSPFPRTHAKSAFGFKMSAKEVEQRCTMLDTYMQVGRPPPHSTQHAASQTATKRPPHAPALPSFLLVCGRGSK